jgi:hypothetical protein
MRPNLLLLVVATTIAACSAQTSAPVKISLRQIGNPQFPTGFWVSNDDPHFRHRSDALFWLSTDKVATIFFKEYCCGSGASTGSKYAAAVFDLKGNTIATHEWTSTPDAPFYVGGIVGAFWVRYKDRVDVLSNDFSVAGQIPLPKPSALIWSKSGHGAAVQTDSTISVYDMVNLPAVLRTAVPADTRAIDVYATTVLLRSPPTKPCYVGVMQANDEHSWNIGSGIEDAASRCVSALALLSDSAVLIAGPKRNFLKIVFRSGTVETINAQGRLLGTADSDRLALEIFHPNPFAEKLDMDFGGHKEISVYDPSRKATVFRVKIGGQSGAALSPDGHHLAVIDGHELRIYALPG